MPTAQPRGEVRFATLLLAGTDRSTPFAELIDLLDAAAQPFGGTVDRLLAEGALLSFGVGRPDPSAARNAIRAARHLQELFQQRHGAHGEGLRIGVHAGDVSLQPLGGSLTATGETVEILQRLLPHVPPGRVWASRAVSHEIRRFFVTAPGATLKGVDPEGPFHLFDVRAERASPLLDMPRFVGRDQELQLLEKRWAEHEQDRTMQVVVVRGGAGVGKSRLAWELRNQVATRQAGRVDVVQYDHGDRSPAHGLSTVTRARLRVPRGMDTSRALEQVRQALAADLPGQDDQILLAAEFFAMVLGVVQPDSRIQRLDARAAWEAARTQMIRWMAAVCARTPWLVVLEDAQRGDVETAELLSFALRMEGGRGPMVVLTLREEDFLPQSPFHPHVEGWSREALTTEIRLGELPVESLAEALVSMTEGGAPLEVAREVAAHADGNPMFATELMALLREEGRLLGQAPLGKLELPLSMREVLAARLERVGEAGREVARRAAVLGAAFDRAPLEQIWDRPREELDLGLTSLLEAEMVREERFSEGAALSFRHARVHDMAQARVSPEERRRWMGRLESWAREKIHLASPAEQVPYLPLLARACGERGGVLERSLWLELLGRHQQRLHRPGASIQALEAAAEGVRGPRRAVLLRWLAEELLAAGQLDRALAVASEKSAAAGAPGAELPAEAMEAVRALQPAALDDWERLGAPEAELALELVRMEALALLGRTTEALQAIQGARARLEAQAGQVAIRLWLRWARASVHFVSEVSGDTASAAAMVKALEGRVAGAVLSPGDRLQLLRVQELMAVRVGRYADAERLLGEQLRASREAGDLCEESIVYNALGIFHAGQGQLHKAKEAYLRAAALAREIGLKRREGVGVHNLGLVEGELGNVAEARRCQEEYLGLSRPVGNHYAEAYGPASIASALLGTAALEEAERYAEQARRIAEERGWYFLKAWAVGLQGQAGLLRASAMTPRAAVQSAADGIGTALRMLHEKHVHWTEELDPGELYAFLAVGTAACQGPGAARAVLDRGQEVMPASCVVSHAWLEAGRALLGGKPATAWFSERGYVRSTSLLERLGTLIQRSV